MRHGVSHTTCWFVACVYIAPAVTSLVLLSAQQFAAERVAPLHAGSEEGVSRELEGLNAVQQLVVRGPVSRVQSGSELARCLTSPRAATTMGEETSAALSRLSHAQLRAGQPQAALLSAQNALVFLVPASANNILPPFVLPPDGPATAHSPILPLHTLLSPVLLDHIKAAAEAKCVGKTAQPPSSAAVSTAPSAAAAAQLPLKVHILRAFLPTSVLDLVFLRQRHVVATGYQQLGLALQAVGDQRQADIAFEFAQHMANIHLPAAPKPVALQSK